MKRWLFVDGNNLAARANYAMKELTTASGQRTGAILGFLKGLSWARNANHMALHNVVVFWDGGWAQGRLDLYPDYKGGRALNEPKSSHEEEDKRQYQIQLEALRNFCAVLGLRSIHVAGVEADDLISIFCELIPGKKVIFSGDGDFHQLYSTNVEIFDPKKGLLGHADICKKWKTELLDQIPFLKAMIGDSSDNITGIEQIGPARARTVLDYLRWNPQAMDLKRKKWIDVAEPEKAAHKKYVDKVKAELSTTINRNILLMRLPRTWSQSFYNEQQAEAALEMWLASNTKMDRRAFISLCKKYELDSILDNMHHW